MLIGLLRHGEVQGGRRFRGRTDDPLTPLGWSQMADAVAPAQGWERVISSPLMRCAAFAAAFARQTGLPLVVDHRLAELDFGAWEGRSAAQLMADDPAALAAFWRDPAAHPPPGGEPLADFTARVVDAWESVITAPTCRRCLVITHGGVIRVLLGYLFERSIAQMLRFDVAYGGLFRVVVGRGGRARPCFVFNGGA